MNFLNVLIQNADSNGAVLADNFNKEYNLEIEIYDVRIEIQDGREGYILSREITENNINEPSKLIQIYSDLMALKEKDENNVVSFPKLNIVISLNGLQLHENIVSDVIYSITQSYLGEAANSLKTESLHFRG